MRLEDHLPGLAQGDLFEADDIMNERYPKCPGCGERETSWSDTHHTEIICWDCGMKHKVKED